MDHLSCPTCREFYSKIRESFARVVPQLLLDDPLSTRGELLKMYIEGYHENDHDEDYALK